MAESFGNTNSTHVFGESALAELAKAEVPVRQLLGADSGAIVWTSGGSEANGLAVSRFCGNGKALVSAIEHKSAVRLPTPGVIGGYLDAQTSGHLLVPTASQLEGIRLVAVMLINNETGALQPIAEIAEAVKSFDASIHVHCDVVAALGKVNIDVDALGVDSIACSAHKIHGPQGVGALWMRDSKKKIMFTDITKRTKPAALIAGFGVAAQMVGQQFYEAHERWNVMTKMILDAAEPFGGRATIAGAKASNVISVAIPNISAAALAARLETHGIIISTRSACTSAASGRSHVLTAMDLPDNVGVLRVSFGYDTTVDDVSRAAKVLSRELEVLRAD